MLTARDAYKTSKAALFVATTHQQFGDLCCDTLENFLNNRLIWEELNFYKREGTILGKHPVFSYLKEISALRSRSVGELIKKKITLESTLRKAKARVKKEKNHPRTFERKKNIADTEKKLFEINRLLNL